MSSYGELIQALKSLKNVKEKRHSIKTLANICADRSFQVRILQKGGWKDAILPLIISLDEECRKHAALAVANLSTEKATHAQLLEEDVLRHLVPILYEEDQSQVTIYVLTAFGNFACSQSFWASLRAVNVMEAVVMTLKAAQMEEVRINALFCLANLSADRHQRERMMELELYELVWPLIHSPNYKIMQYALCLLRGLSVETKAQEIFPRMGIVPILIGIFQNPASPKPLKALVLDIFLHLSFSHGNATVLLEDTVATCIESAARSFSDMDFVIAAVATVANLCENVELHDRITESKLFDALHAHILNEATNVQAHVIRGLMHLALSPKYHHVILSSGVMVNVCPIAMTDKLPASLRTNALQLMASVCATHPTTPTESDVIDLLFLSCNDREHLEVRRFALLSLANAAADKNNAEHLTRKRYIEALVNMLPTTTDKIFIDYLTQFFHNACKLDDKVGQMLIQSGYGKHMFHYQMLASLSVTAAVYLCDTMRQLAEATAVRAELMSEMIFATLLDAWEHFLDDPQIAPHLSLMASAFTFYKDTHQEFVLQGGVRLVVELYTKSQVEHVRLCCLLTLLYLSDTSFSQRSIAQERGITMLLQACENESHMDLVTNSLKALIPFASSEEYRPQLGMDGALDTFASFLFSDQLELRQLGVYLTQNLLELKANRQIFLGLSEEKRCEEDYLEPLVRILPTVKMGPPEKIQKMKEKKETKKDKRSQRAAERAKAEEGLLTEHDPFVVRCTIHCLALLSLEHQVEVHQKFLNLNVPRLLYNLFYSEQIDRSSGEATLLFFAEMLHTGKDIQVQLMRTMDLVPMLLTTHEMGFEHFTNLRCLSALLSIARSKEFRSRVLVCLDLIMVSLNANLSQEKRNEDFYSVAAVHCALLCELANGGDQAHAKMAMVGVIEAYLMFITIAGKGLNNETCIELLMASVYGISTLVASQTHGDIFMRSLLFPATRLQLFVSLLRLPQQDIDTTFHVGTIGLKTLQRTAHPSLSPDELHTDRLDLQQFLDLCGVLPAHFIYRHIVKTVCLLLSNEELRAHAQSAISPQNILPTCLFALRGTTDTYVQTFGYELVALLTRDHSMRTTFTNATPIMNELVTFCRRFASDFSHTDMEGKYKNAIVHSSQAEKVRWTPSTVAFNKYLLTMVVLVNLSEHVRVRYNTTAVELRDQALAARSLVRRAGEETQDSEGQGAGELTKANLTFINNMAATCLRSLDTDYLVQFARLIKDGEDVGEADVLETPKIMTAVMEYLAMLSIVIVHNSLMAHITNVEPDNARPYLGLADGHAAESFAGMDESQASSDRALSKKSAKAAAKAGTMMQQEEVPPDLRTEFRSLKALQLKCDGMVSLVETCLENSTARKLTVATIECLCCLTYLSPQSISDPVVVFNLIRHRYDSVQQDLTCLFANSLAEPTLELEWFERTDAGFLFPLLTSSLTAIRRHTLGALANSSVHEALFHFVKSSGVLQLYTAIPNRAYFVEHFVVILEMVRLLGNTSSYIKTHVVLNSEHIMGFLGDVLHNCYALLHGVFPRERALEKYRSRLEPDEDEVKEHLVQVNFDEDAESPLGLKIKWLRPPQVVGIVPDTPAARIDPPTVFEGDELLSVNDVDVTELSNEDITPMLAQRPLYLVFRRGKGLEDEDDEFEEGDHAFSYGEKTLPDAIQEIGESLGGHDPQQYRECLHLSLLVLHNLSTTTDLHARMLAEPKILDFLFDLVPSPILTPSLRRLVFSTLTCLCQQPVVAFKIFKQMQQYCIEVDNADKTLQRYILLAANLFYMNSPPNQIEPDRGTFVFVSRLAATNDVAGVRTTLIEILHRISLCPHELRKQFVCREVLVVVIQFLDMHAEWDVQVRAFEAAYLLTIGALQPQLWAAVELVARMIRAASIFQRKENRDSKSEERENALWQLAMRTASLIYEYEILVPQLAITELDHYLMEVFRKKDKPVSLLHSTAHLMSCMLRSSLGASFWGRWKNSGILEMIQAEFVRFGPQIGNEGDTVPSIDNIDMQEAGEARSGLDALVHILFYAVEADPLCAEALLDLVFVNFFKQRLAQHAAFFKSYSMAFPDEKIQDDEDDDDDDELEAAQEGEEEEGEEDEEEPPSNLMSRSGSKESILGSRRGSKERGSRRGSKEPQLSGMVLADTLKKHLPSTMGSFRIITRLLTLLANTPSGLQGLNRLEIAPCLLAILELPFDDLKTASLLVLTSLSAQKETCITLVKSKDFKRHVKSVEKGLKGQGSTPPIDIVELFAAILDRAATFLDLAKIVMDKFWGILCYFAMNAESVDAQVSAMRAICHCGFACPEELNSFAHEEVGFFRFLMAANSCLRSDTYQIGGQSTSIARRQNAAKIAQGMANHPFETRLLIHLSRILLCKAFSVSVEVCRAGLKEIDFKGLLSELDASFHSTYSRVEELRSKAERQDLKSMLSADAELLNGFLSSMHMVITVIFRRQEGQADDEDEDEEESRQVDDDDEEQLDSKGPRPTRRIKDVLKSVLEAVYGRLFLARKAENPQDPQVLVANAFCGDLRVLYFLSGILREICTKPVYSNEPGADFLVGLPSEYLTVVRSQRFYDVLQASIVIAREAFAKKDKHREDPFSMVQKQKDSAFPLAAGMTSSGVGVSPLAAHLEDCNLAAIFLQLIVCLRYVLIQSMYVVPPESEMGGKGDANLPEHMNREPWRRQAQETLAIHVEAATWLPEIAIFFRNTPGITEETTRYFAAIATFRVAPVATHAEKTFATGDQETKKPQHNLAKLYSLSHPLLLECLVEGMNLIADPKTQSLACLAIADLTSHQRETLVQQYIDGPLNQTAADPFAELFRVVPVVMDVLRRAPKVDPSIRPQCTIQGLRVIMNFLMFDITDFVRRILSTELMDLLQSTFQELFADAYAIKSDNDFAIILKNFVLLMRTWIAAGHFVRSQISTDPAENAPPGEEEEPESPESPKPGSRGRRAVNVLDMGAGRQGAKESPFQRMKRNLSTSTFLNFLTKIVLKLTDAPREIPNKDDFLESVFDDVIVSIRTLLHFEDAQGKTDWRNLTKQNFESMLVDIQIFRKGRSPKHDGDMVNVLYLMVKLGFQFGRKHFPDYLSNVAYGPSEQHTKIQDVAAVCCSILSTQGGAGGKGSMQVGDILNNAATFVKGLITMSEPTLRVWHYRVICHWSKIPKVVEGVSTDKIALNYVVQTLVDPELGKHSTIFVHNISVLRCYRLVDTVGSLTTVCEAYKKFYERSQDAPSKRDARDSRLLCRLCTAIVRNCIVGVEDFCEAVDDADFDAILRLGAALDQQDVPLYLSGLLFVCRQSAKRAATISGHQALVKLLVECIMEPGAYGHPPRVPGEEAEEIGQVYDMDIRNAQLRMQNQINGLDEDDEDEDHEELQHTAQRPQAHLSADSSPKAGLGKKQSLYHKKRTQQAAAIVKSVSGNSTKAVAVTSTSAADQRRVLEEEYLYFMAAEILVQGTVVDEPTENEELIIKERRAAQLEKVQIVVMHAMDASTVFNLLKKYKQQVSLHEGKKLQLSEQYVQVSAHLLLHGWSQTTFKPLFATPHNLELLSQIAPFFLSWPSSDVQEKIASVCLRANLHRFPTVCMHVSQNHKDNPELACGMLTHGLLDVEAQLLKTQPIQFLQTIVQLLRSRQMTRSSLRRIAISFMRMLVMDRPAKIGSTLTQTEHEILGDLLEELTIYTESSIIQQSIVICLAYTLGKHYRNLPKLDPFVLRVMDMVSGLLEREFIVFFPLLHRLAVYGGKRIQGLMLQKGTHFQVLKILEPCIVAREEHCKQVHEHQRRKTLNARAEAEGQALDDSALQGPGKGDQKDLLKIRWILNFFSVLMVDRYPNVMGDMGKKDAQVFTQDARSDPFATGLLRDVQFSNFVNVEVLSILVRVLKSDPEPLEASIALFMLSLLGHSASIVPQLPALLNAMKSRFSGFFLEGAREAFSTAYEYETVPDVAAPPPSRMLLAAYRNFIHLLVQVSSMPSSHKAILTSGRKDEQTDPAMFLFLQYVARDNFLFADPDASLHSALYFMCNVAREFINHERLYDLKAPEFLQECEAHLLTEIPSMPEAVDLRLVWIRAVCFFIEHSGQKLIKGSAGVDMLSSSLVIGEKLLEDYRSGQGSFSLALDCEHDLAVGLLKLYSNQQFEPFKAQYLIILLAFICRAVSLRLRLAACNCAIELLTRKSNPEAVCAQLVQTSAKQSFVQILEGPDDELAIALAKMMTAFVEAGGHRVREYFVEVLMVVLIVMADPSTVAPRVFEMGRLFAAITSEHDPDILGSVCLSQGFQVFLGFGLSQQATRRELALRWLEFFGSSLYELEQVSDAFRASSLRGFLRIGTHCVLLASEAQDLRRIIFEVFRRQFEEWRNSMMGSKEFLSEELLQDVLDMCEKQPDLVDSVVTLLHSFLEHQEFILLDRLWRAGRYAWLCDVLKHKSALQKRYMQNAGTLAEPQSSNQWEHPVLAGTQGRVLRLLWELYKGFTKEICTVAVETACVLGPLHSFAKFYFEEYWPESDDNGTNSLEGSLVLVTKLAVALVEDSDEEGRKKLIKQGIIDFFFMLLLPRPQKQKSMVAAIEGETKEGDNEAPASFIHKPATPEIQKMAAGALVTLLGLIEGRQYVQQRAFADTTLALFGQVHHWSQFLMENQGTLSVIATVSLEERLASLYLVVLSLLQIEWLIQYLTLPRMGLLYMMFLNFWQHHPNGIVSHHSLRLVTAMCQIKVLWIAIFSHPPAAEAMRDATGMTLNRSDVRDQRFLIRMFIASLGHVFGMQVIADEHHVMVTRALSQESGAGLQQLFKDGSVLRANRAVAKNLLVENYLARTLEKMEQFKDVFCRTWGLWLYLAILSHAEEEGPGAPKAAWSPETQTAAWGNETQTDGTMDMNDIIVLEDVNIEQLLRRQEVMETQKQVSAALATAYTGVAQEAKTPESRISWLTGNPKLCFILSRLVGQALVFSSDTSRLISASLASFCMVELPPFLPMLVHTVTVDAVISCFSVPEHLVHANVLLFCAIITSFKLPILSQTITQDFLDRFWALQAGIIKGLVGGEATSLDGPFDLLTRWLTNAEKKLPCEKIFKGLSTFVVGQCCKPPLAAPPSLGSQAASGHVQNSGDFAQDKEDYPPVIEGFKPPQSLLEVVAKNIITEDDNLKKSQIEGKGPLFSTDLCHLLYALAVMVPHHPKVASHSSVVRGAAFTQMIKIQNILVQGVQPPWLYDTTDGATAKPFLYVRSMTCVRAALQCVVGSWLAAGFGTRFAVTEEGGKDFIQYCVKHILQFFNNKAALTRVLGSPWERVMMSQGPTPMIVELFLTVCSVDSNLTEVAPLGGQAALHNLSRYADTNEVRQQATILLTKLAVLQVPEGVKKR